MPVPLRSSRVKSDCHSPDSPLQRSSARRNPFDHPSCIFELKMDGFLALEYIDRGKCELVSRKETCSNPSRRGALNLRSSTARQSWTAKSSAWIRPFRPLGRRSGRIPALPFLRSGASRVEYINFAVQCFCSERR